MEAGFVAGLHTAFALAGVFAGALVADFFAVVAGLTLGADAFFATCCFLPLPSVSWPPPSW